MPEAVVVDLHSRRADPQRAQPRDGRTLQTVGLTLEAGGKRVVDNLDLLVPSATLTVVLGPNGAGKSVLLRLAHGLIAPTSGTVLWGAEPIGDAVRRRQAMVFQKPVLLRRSVAANLDYAIRERGSAARARREELLSMVGLSAFARQPARRLSGGEQQRLALARALATNPQVLLLDEATANLDTASVAMIETILRHVRAKGTKIIMVTHDLGQARRLADDIVFMHRGRVAEQAPAQTFFAKPSTGAARGFLAGEIVL